MAEMENATSATHDLRAMLDERGVEYETNDVQVSDTEWCYVTKLRDGHNDRWTYEELPGTDLLVSYQYDLGAEDAVAATLGPKACHITVQDNMAESQDEPVFIVKLTGILRPDDIERYARKFSEQLPGRVVVVDGRVEDIYRMTRLDVEKLVMMLEGVG